MNESVLLYGILGLIVIAALSFLAQAIYRNKKGATPLEIGFYIVVFLGLCLCAGVYGKSLQVRNEEARKEAEKYEAAHSTYTEKGKFTRCDPVKDHPPNENGYCLPRDIEELISNLGD
jgi:hypothetical protein